MIIHLRYFHPDGSSKDWIAEAGSSGLAIRFGKTGRGLQERFIPSLECHLDPINEAQKRATKKLQKGYMLVKQQPSLDGVVPPSPKERKPTVVERRPGISSALKKWSDTDNQSWF